MALTLLAVAILLLSKNRRDGHVPDVVGSPPALPAFDPRDLGRTAVWAGNVLAPLEAAANAAASIENGIVRADAVKAEAERIKAALGPLTGPLGGVAVSWEGVGHCCAHLT